MTLDPELYQVVPFEPRKANGDGRGSRKIPAIASAAQLRRKIFEPIRYVVPDYLVEGCTLLAGRPKLGKSWLVLDIGLAVASGGSALGHARCEQGDVLYLALEDNERRLQRRIDKVLGPLAAWPERFTYATEWPRANEGGVEAIRNWILEAENPRLVIVDVIAMFRAARGDRETLYEADYQAVKGLQALAGEFGIAIVGVHHTRKSGSEAADPFEKVSGTLGLSGGADTTIVLDRDGNGATLYGRGRDIEEFESAVTFDRETCRWTVLGDPADIRRSDERKAILDALREADEPLSPKEIMAATGRSSEKERNALDALLFKMVRDGEVEKAGRGMYILPSPHNPDKNGKKVRSDRDGKAPSDA